MHCFPVILAAALCCGADHEPDKKPAVLLEGLGSLRHPVSTKSEEAQRFFDQGLSLLYAFNHDEAARSFRRAAELDEKLAMAWWGLALVQGPNYNMAQIDPAQAKAAYEALQKALKLAEGAPAHERAYIEALAERYSVDPKADGKKLLAAYAKAMGRLAERYPDDLDAVTLHAESLMNLRPWKLWTPEGKAEEGTEEIVRLLESVLRRRWATMIDVGCAAGYYTTGFALRCPEARVIGFEGDDGLAELARRTAAANGVADRVEIRGFCDPDDLAAVLGPDTFVMLDVEGHEAVLADPQRVPGLAAATLLVEVHDFAVKGLSSELLGRFAGSHHLTVLHAARPSRRAVPEASGLPVHLRRWVVDDHRPAGMRWLLCQPRTGAASGSQGQTGASGIGSPLLR